MTTSISSSVSATTPALYGNDFSRAENRDPKELAQQFEGIFISMLVKEMRQASFDGEGMFPGDNSDTFGGIFDMYMGEHMARQGGIGLADSIAASIAKHQKNVPS